MTISSPGNFKLQTKECTDSASSPSFYVGIDVGTGSARACVINQTGDIVGLASEDIQTWRAQHDLYEQSTSDIWRGICLAVRSALADGHVHPSNIRGIGFGATCSLAVFSRDSDQPVSVHGPDFDRPECNVILWLDHRAVEEAELVNRTNHRVLKYVGGRMSAEMEVPKILWLKRHMPPEVFANCKFYDLADALTHMATGTEKRSYCSVVCKQGYIPSHDGWQEDFFVNIGLEDVTKDNYSCLGGVAGLNGQFLEAGEPVSTLSVWAASQLGLPQETVVGSGVIDAYAGWIGSVATKVDLGLGEACGEDMQSLSTRLAAVAGTSTCHLAMSPEPLFIPGIWGPYRDTLVAGYWMVEGGQSATGELIRHIVQSHPAFYEAKSMAQACGKNITIYDYLSSRLRSAAAEQKTPHISYLARHFFFYGDYWGNRSPIADHRMRGSVIGLSSDSSSIDNLALWYYATLEFIALQTKHIIDSMSERGHTITSIFMSGSQCQNEILVELIATACRMPVVIPHYLHAAVCHGAAMLGARAASTDGEGRIKSLLAIMRDMRKPGRRVDPTEEEQVKALLRVKYDVFLDMCVRQQEYRTMVNSVVAG